MFGFKCSGKKGIRALAMEMCGLMSSLGRDSDRRISGCKLSGKILRRPGILCQLTNDIVGLLRMT